jgi:hypothetical protein
MRFRAGGAIFVAREERGILVGDGRGQLANSEPEQIFETYFKVMTTQSLNVTVDDRMVDHLTYNAGRGLVHVFGFRLRTQSLTGLPGMAMDYSGAWSSSICLLHSRART